MSLPELLEEWKSRFNAHKSVTLTHSFNSFRTNTPGLLEARSTFLAAAKAKDLLSYQSDRFYSRKRAFEAFDEAIALSAKAPQ